MTGGPASIIDVALVERFPIQAARGRPQLRDRAIVRAPDGHLLIVTLPGKSDAPMVFEASLDLASADKLARDVMAGNEWAMTMPDTLRILAAAVTVPSGGWDGCVGAGGGPVAPVRPALVEVEPV